MWIVPSASTDSTMPMCSSQTIRSPGWGCPPAAGIVLPERSGKAIPAAGAQPQPGDLIVWDEHIGVVESVGPDGSIRTIEGNSSDQVARRTYGADGGGAIGYVRLG